GPGRRRRELHADRATSPRRHRAAAGPQPGKGKVAADQKAAAERQRGVARVGERYVLDEARGAHRLIAERERGGRKAHYRSRGARRDPASAQAGWLRAARGVVGDRDAGRSSSRRRGLEGHTDNATRSRRQAGEAVGGLGEVTAVGAGDG